MESDIQAVKSTLNSIQSDGLVTAIDTGQWGAASGLGDATGNAFSAISEFTSDMITAHQAVVDRINQSAQAYRDAEANNTAAASGVGSGVGSAPASGGGGSIPAGPGSSGGLGSGAGNAAADVKAPSGGSVGGITTANPSSKQALAAIPKSLTNKDSDT